jgi:hypothetical protein
MTDKEAMKLALDALEYWDVQGKLHQPTEEAITALKARLAQPHETTLKEFNQLIHDDPKYHTWAKEKALQALHNENERLGLYKDAYAQPESECNPQDLCAGCRCKYAHVQPEQEPVSVELPCCGYTDASAVKWNPFNRIVQCHNCGQTYTPPQRTEQNFCSRCGKRTPDLTHIHTCTPPKENT